MNSWTFETPEIAANFDAHVREQLPWYDMVTGAVQYIIRNYLPEHGTVVDIGASTGNLIEKILPIVLERNGDVIAVDKSKDMVAVLNKKFLGRPSVWVHHEDVISAAMHKGEVYVLFLTLMFIPVEYRRDVIDAMRAACSKGGVIIVVDKVYDHGGYFATVLKRLTMQFKLQQGANPEDVLNKEMSLAGIQIPIDPAILGADAKQFFRMGEFAGWVIEK